MGIECNIEELAGPCSPNHARKLEVPGKFCDREFVECYRLDAYDGPLDADAQEVHDLQWVDVAQLISDAKANSERYTPWLREEMHRMHWFGDPYCQHPQLAMGQLQPSP